MKNVTNVLEYLERSAKKFPEKQAYIDESGGYTFKRIMEIAKTVGSFLAQKTGTNLPIVVYMEKSIRQIAAFFGIVYAGAFYVPIDVQMPQQRVKLILETLNANCLLTDEKSKGKAERLGFSGEIFTFEQILDFPIDEAKLRHIRRNAIDSDPLYAIFTSGSTGVPKGVLISRRSAVNFTEWYCEAFHHTEAVIFGNQTPFYFDASVKQIYATIRCAATMYIIPKTLFSFPIKLIEYLNTHQINCID